MDPMNNKHVKNFTELFESNSKETSTDELIILAETGIIPWKEVIDTVFDRGELAVIYWLFIQSAAVFANDRVVVKDKTDESQADRTIEEVAYNSGAKMVLMPVDFLGVYYDKGEKSVRLQYEDMRRVRLATRKTVDKLSKPNEPTVDQPDQKHEK